MTSPFTTQMQKFQFLDKYSRFSHESGRRETWEEAVERSVQYLIELSEGKLNGDDYDDIRNAMLNMEAFPSMRLFAMAGDAARRDNSVLYNCSYIGVDSVVSISEALYLSMSGVGVGYSVESRYISKLPTVGSFESKYHGVRDTSLIIDDTQAGWAKAFEIGLSLWMSGSDIRFDYGLIRPAGTVLKTKGGRASGHGVLKDLLDCSRSIIMNAYGRQLTSVEVHDIMTSIGDCARSGGSRRSALLSLFDRDDQAMLHSKDNGWWKESPQRANANNSIVVETSLERGEISAIMHTMNEGGSGEPGFFLRQNATKFSPRRDGSHIFGLNPCAEIHLRSNEFCNLSQSIVRSDDTIETLQEKVRIATIIGTIQSTATNFEYLSPLWKKNTEEERLLGVDITGMSDAPHLFTPESLTHLRSIAIQTNKEYAEKLGISQSVAVTTNKPSGNSSVLFSCSAGIHSRWADYYIRRVRLDALSPMKKLFDYAGVKLHPENGQQLETANTFVAEFPMKAPDGAITNGTRSAIEQMDWWKLSKTNWTEHNVSATISYLQPELEDMIDWLYENQDIVGGMSFLPYDQHTYPLAPYEKIDKEMYEKMVKEMPVIDFNQLQYLENDDNTTVAQELACVSGVCEI